MVTDEIPNLEDLNNEEFDALFGASDSPADSSSPVTFEEFKTLLGERGAKLSPERLQHLWESTRHIPPAELRKTLSSSVYNPHPMDGYRGGFESAVTFAHVEPRESTDRRLLLAYPQAIFKPSGLWLWGCDPTTLVRDMKVGNITGYSLSHVPLPGLYFEAGLSFAEFEQLLETPSSEWSHEKLKHLPPVREHQKIRLNTAEVGNNIVLDVEGPITHAVMWGKTVL